MEQEEPMRARFAPTRAHGPNRSWDLREGHKAISPYQLWHAPTQNSEEPEWLMGNEK